MAIKKIDEWMNGWMETKVSTVDFKGILLYWPFLVCKGIIKIIGSISYGVVEVVPFQWI